MNPSEIERDYDILLPKKSQYLCLFMNFYSKSIAQVVSLVQTNQSTGLSGVEAAARAKKEKNELPHASASASRLRIFLEQWKSPLIIILVAAGAISGFLGETIDMTIIFITALLNAAIGYFQEYKANAALEHLRSLVSFNSIVIRDGKQQEVPSTALVAGDIVILQAGDRVPADGRIIVADACKVEEAALTGESAPVKKQTAALSDDNVQLGERKNMVFRGTTVVEGSCHVIITAVGVHTELGKIATLVKETNDELTPLQQQLAAIAKKLSIIIVCMALAIFVIGLLFGQGRYHVLELFETAIAVAVAAIPEGLVISLTVILAIGMQFILKRRALVRKLVAAETLGSVSVICTDKTGTLTEGNMSVVEIHTASGVTKKSGFAKLPASSDAYELLHVAAVCNDAIAQEKDGKIQYIGNMTDRALLAAADLRSIDRSLNRLASVPFSSRYKFMATAHKEGKDAVMFVKGAPEVMLEKASHYLKAGKKVKLSKKQHDAFVAKAADMASKGYRTLAVAKGSWKGKSLKQADVDGLTLMGIVAIADPLRDDVADTIKIAQRAGIRIIMVTGDHAKTAMAIGKELGLVKKNDHVCEGKELDALDDDQLKARIANTTVFARVAPEHKIRIVRALQSQGEIVAMTGDGVNDAPALKGADIGVAVGSGTDVAKQTADMVLLDDSFSTIVAAVEEGRGIYQNIKKVVLYLLSGSFAEVVMITGSIVAGLPVAALPAQILWVNIIEDAFPTMALAFDPADKEIMDDKPRRKGASLIDSEMRSMIIAKSILANVLLFGIFVYFLKVTGDIKLTRTIVFVGFAIDALFYIFSIRSLRHMIWQIPLFNNLYLLGAVAFGWVMLLLAIYWAPLQLLLRTVPLEPIHWAIMILFGICNLCLIELVKAVFILKQRYYVHR